MHLPPPLPRTREEIAAALTLTHFAAVTGVQRHAGQLAHLYTPTGRQTVARGRDLTACRLLIGTGGALTRLPGGEAMLADTRAQERRRGAAAAAAGRALRPRPRLHLRLLRRAAGALPGDAVVALMRPAPGSDGSGACRRLLPAALGAAADPLQARPARGPGAPGRWTGPIAPGTRAGAAGVSGLRR